MTNYCRSFGLVIITLVVVSLPSCGGLAHSADYNRRSDKGERIGMWIAFNDTTKQFECTTYRAGIPDGPASGYYREGGTSYKGSYQCGKKDGRGTQYRPNGEVGGVRVYRNDSVVEMELYNPSW